MTGASSLSLCSPAPFVLSFTLYMNITSDTDKALTVELVRVTLNMSLADASHITVLSVTSSRRLLAASVQVQIGFTSPEQAQAASLLLTGQGVLAALAQAVAAAMVQAGEAPQAVSVDVTSIMVTGANNTVLFSYTSPLVQTNTAPLTTAAPLVRTTTRTTTTARAITTAAIQLQIPTTFPAYYNATPTPDTSAGSTFNVAVVAGAVGGGLAFVLVASVIAYFLYTRKPAAAATATPVTYKAVNIQDETQGQMSKRCVIAVDIDPGNYAHAHAVAQRVRQFQRHVLL